MTIAQFDPRTLTSLAFMAIMSPALAHARNMERVSSADEGRRAVGVFFDRLVSLGVDPKLIVQAATSVADEMIARSGPR